MIGASTEFNIQRSSFLEYFPTDCQETCLIAKAAAALAARQVLELEITFEKVSEVLAHRFGRCALGPDIIGMCGKKSLCNNEIVSGIDNLEAAEILATI